MVSDYCHASPALLQVVGWVDPRTSLNAVAKTEIITSNGSGFSGHPDHSCGTVKYILNRLNWVNQQQFSLVLD